MIGSSGTDEFPDAGPDDTVEDKPGLQLGIQVDAGPDLVIPEGEWASLLARFTNRNPFVTHTASVDWGDGSLDGSLTLDMASRQILGSHRYLDDGSYTVVVTVHDDFGVTASDRRVVRVDNVDPTIDEVLIPTTGVQGQVIPLSASASDPGIYDALSFAWAVTLFACTTNHS